MVETQARESFFERTLGNLASAWREVAASAARTVGRNHAAAPEADPERLRRLMRECLAERGGEVSARLRAAELGRAYLALDAGGKAAFLRILAHDFAVDETAVDAAIATYREAPHPAGRLQAEAALRRALMPPRVKLLTQFNALPEGVKFLVDLRADLLPLVGDDAHLRALDEDLHGLLASWFDVGFLDLQRITWDSPASLLERLIAYEAVHEIRDWSDLRGRLESDRRCFALFHPRMPQEPLAFVEVALTRGMADSIQALLDEGTPHADPQRADAAIFYSISNTQRGLRGISFGEHLIKRVVFQLAQELPRVETFATLSPMPGFRVWLDSAPDAILEALVDDDERRTLARLAGQQELRAALQVLLAAADWPRDEAVRQALEAPLQRLASRYLLERRDTGQPLDPVARFHLRNGAWLERINWLGDTSAKGLRQSAGMMVNYRYVLDDLERNHEAYMREGRIALGPGVKAVVRGWRDAGGTSLKRLAAGQGA